MKAPKGKVAKAIAASESAIVSAAETAGDALGRAMHAAEAAIDEHLHYGELRRDLIRAERAAVLRLRDEGKVSQDVQRLIERDLDLEEARLR